MAQQRNVVDDEPCGPTEVDGDVLVPVSVAVVRELRELQASDADIAMAAKLSWRFELTRNAADLTNVARELRYIRDEARKDALARGLTADGAQSVADRALEMVSGL